MSETVIPIGVKTIGASTYRGRKAQTLLQAARHNLRDIQKELGANSHIDAGRTCLNETIAGPDTPKAVVALAMGLMTGAGASKLRKDYTQAHELLFTLAADTTVNLQDYFRRCVSWAAAQFGRDNILSAVIHLDESAPHLHVLIVPIEDGHYRGTSLIDRARLAKLRALFAVDVAPEFGLKVLQPLAGAMRAKVILMIYERLELTHDPVLQSPLWLTFKLDVARNPATYMAHLGIVLEHDVPVNDGGKAFKRIALSTGKGGKTERRVKPYGFETGESDDVLKPYGFESHLKSHRNPSCVGFPQNPPSPATTKPALAVPLPTPEKLPENEIEAAAASFLETRVRETDLDPAMYDTTTGEYFKRPPAPARHQRQAADAWVTAALANALATKAHHHR